MSIQLFKTAKMILNRHLVPDMVREIINLVQEYYIKKGKEIHKNKLIKLNLEYDNTWFVHEYIQSNSVIAFLYIYRKKCHVNDRHLASDINIKYVGIFSFIKNSEIIVCPLPINYKFSSGLKVS